MFPPIAPIRALAILLYPGSVVYINIGHNGVILLIPQYVVNFKKVIMYVAVVIGYSKI